MAPSLPDLPAELLLLIVELSESMQKPPYSTQRLMMKSLRAVHPQINEKLVLSYGAKYFKQLWVTIDRATLSCFSKAVAGHLGIHVDSLIFDTSDLIEESYRCELSDSTDAELNSWHTSKSTKTFGEPMNVHHGFNDDVVEVIVDGTYANFLAEALMKLPNLTSVAVYPPTAPAGLDSSKARDVKERTLENGAEDLQSLHAQVFARFFNNAAALDDLRIVFYDSTDTFFKALATSMSPKHLTKLHITHVKARYKYWATFLGMFQDSLRSLEMNNITFTKTDEQYHVFEFLCGLRLERCILRKISVAGHMLDFTIVHDDMPETEERVRKRPGKGPANGETITVKIKKGAKDELLLSEQDDEYCHGVGHWLYGVCDIAAEDLL